jgi:DNA-binding MarR family transcriptional regulator
MSLTTPPTTHDAVGDHDGYECARAWTMLRSIYTLVNGRLEEELSRQCGITPNEFEAMVYLHGIEPDQARLGDLQGAVTLSQPALSRMVVRLEQAGIIGRNESAADKRVVLLSLTDFGHDLLERSALLHAGIVRALLTERLTSDEQERLVQTLSRVSEGRDPRGRA